MVFGQTDSLSLAVTVKSIGVFAIAFTGAITDLLRGKIYNGLTLPAMLTGLAASGWLYGWAGLGAAAIAVGLGFLLYSWIYFLGAMAAGDVKFLMALAAWGGPNPAHFVVDTAILGLILGGALALVSLAARGRLVTFGRKIWRLLYSSALASVAKDFEVEAPRVDSTLTIPFGVPLAVAAGCAVVADPLVRAGWGIWAP